jgi:serine/threonine protein kinase
MDHDPDDLQSQQVDAAIAEYLDAVKRREPPDHDSFLLKYNGVAAELKEFLDDHQLLDAAARRFDASASTDHPQTTNGKPVTDAAYSSLPRAFGNFELLEEVARGGMGVVFKARQLNPSRTVALKMILAGQLASQDDVNRFAAEAHAAAALDHPHIVPIFEVGQHDGQHYFTMAFVEGLSLAQRLANGPLLPREAAQIIREVASAVEYAHQRGVIHRDLKPANVLLDNAGRVRVTDFGLAKRTTDETGLTGTGQLLGTPSFMSPEQVTGDPEKIGPASDVYSLGATLYALATGRPPFQAANTIDVLKQVLDKEVVPPRQLDASIPRDLETITLKCLQKDAAKRYGTAQALADDLERFLENRPILARRSTQTERFRRWCRRNPVVAGLTAAVAALLVAAVAILALSNAQIRRESSARSVALVRAVRAEQEAISERDAKEVHRREAVANARQATAVSDLLVGAFRSPSPLRNGRTVTIAEVLDRAKNQVSEQFSNDPVVEGALLHAVGESYRALALYDEAIHTLERARQIRVRTLGRHHPDAIRCVRDLGWAYIVADRPIDALPMFDENFRVTQVRLGPKDPVSLQCAYDLAFCYFELGRREDSLKLITETLALQKIVLGHDSPDTVESMSELARNYSWAGRSDDAINLYQQVIEFATEHPDPFFKLQEMEAKEGLALVFAKLHRFDDAQTLIEESVKLFEMWLGLGSRGVRNAIESRASIYASHVNFLCNAANVMDRNPKRALQLAHKAIEVDPKAFRAMLSLGWAEYRLDHWQPSIEALEKSCALEPGGTGNAFQWFFLAMAHWHLGHKQETRNWYDKAIEWMDKNDPTNEELIRLRAEAAELLGITQPEPSIETTDNR